MNFAKKLRLGQLLSIAVLFLCAFPAAGQTNPGQTTELPDSASKGCGAAEPDSASRSDWAAFKGKSVELGLEHDGLDRNFRLYLPSSYRPGKPMALVLNIHGYTGSALNNEKNWSRMNLHAEQKGYVLVYPQSTSFDSGGGVVTSWNDLACSSGELSLPELSRGPACAADAFEYPCPPECGECGRCNWCSCHDDVGYIETLLDLIEDELCIDTTRVHAVGFSNGGMFVHRLGCALAGRFASVAPFAGTLAAGFSCAPGSQTGPGGEIESRPGLLLLSGTADRTVPLDGSRSSDGYYYTPNRQVAAQWAAALECSSERSAIATGLETEQNALRCVEHLRCTGGRRVVDCEWRARHDWPRSQGVEFGHELLWQFFESNTSSGGQTALP